MRKEWMFIFLIFFVVAFGCDKKKYPESDSNSNSVDIDIEESDMDSNSVDIDIEETDLDSNSGDPDIQEADEEDMNIDDMNIDDDSSDVDQIVDNDIEEPVECPEGTFSLTFNIDPEGSGSVDTNVEPVVSPNCFNPGEIFLSPIGSEEFGFEEWGEGVEKNVIDLDKDKEITVVFKKKFSVELKKMVNESNVVDERYSAGSFVFKDKVWIYGGFTGFSIYSPIFKGPKYSSWYSEDMNNWTLASQNDGISGTRLVFNDKVYVNGWSRVEQKNGVFMSTDGTNWTMVKENPPAGDTFVFKDKLWVIGDAPGNNVYSSDDGIEWTLEKQNADLPPREFAVFVPFDDKILKIGGYGRSESYRFIWYSTNGYDWTKTTIERECLVNQWVQFLDKICFSIMPFDMHTSKDVLCIDKDINLTVVEGKYGMGVGSFTIFKDKFWIYGGVQEDGFSDRVFYSEDLENWSTFRVSTEEFPVGISAGIVKFDDKLWVFGGYEEYSEGSYAVYGVWSSEDALHWDYVETNNFDISGDAKAYVFKEKIFVSDGENKLYSSDDGVIWEMKSEGFPGIIETDYPVYSYITYKTILFNDSIWLNNYNSKVIFSSSDGFTWTESSTQLPEIGAIEVYNESVWLFGNNFIWKSEDFENWEKVNDFFLVNGEEIDLLGSYSLHFTFLYDNYMWYSTADLDFNGFLFYTKDGYNYNKIDINFPEYCQLVFLADNITLFSELTGPRSVNKYIFEISR